MWCYREVQRRFSTYLKTHLLICTSNLNYPNLTVQFNCAFSDQSGFISFILPYSHPIVIYVISALVPLSIRVLEAGTFSSTQLIDSWPLLTFHGTETTEWSSGTHAQFLLSIHALLVQNFKFFVIEFGDIPPMFWKFSSFSAFWKSGWAKYLWLRWGVWYTTRAGNIKLSRRRGKKQDKCQHLSKLKPDYGRAKIRAMARYMWAISTWHSRCYIMKNRWGIWAHLANKYINFP